MKVKPPKKGARVTVETSRRDEAMLERSQAAATPFAIRTILVPVDFSETSKKALDYAVPFAQQFKARLILLYVVPANFPVGEFGMVDVAFMEKELRAAGEKQLAELARDRVGAGVATQTFVRAGRPVTEIAAIAKSTNSDLIVISTHGHTGLKHVLLGSVAENVVRYAPCPVLVVREDEHEFLKALSP